MPVDFEVFDGMTGWHFASISCSKSVAIAAHSDHVREVCDRILYFFIAVLIFLISPR